MSATRIGPYEVVRELGRGGMGVVLEVRHPDLPRRLALKVISRDAVSPEALERFSREARLLARIKHPHVVGVHTFATAEDGRQYLVTDLVEGENLKDVARAEPVEPRRAARIVSALASAVSALHALGIIHRDLKPENVILRKDDTPVLLDFGLAREHDAQRLTQTGTFLGTPAYMSPEQAGGDVRSLDGRTDVYGLGAILFELLAGRAPFDGPPIQIVNAVLSREPRWPARADLPRDLDRVLRKAMAKQPDERHATAAALAADLAHVASGVALKLGGQRSRAGLVAAAGVVVIAAVVGGVASSRRSVPPPPPDPRTEATPTPVTSRAAPPPAPEPSWNEKEPVELYRLQTRWLASGESVGHPRRERVAANLARRRAEETPLRAVAWSQLGSAFPVVRFGSDRQLIVIDNSMTISTLDVDRGRSLEPGWRVQNAPLNVAVAGGDRADRLFFTAYASFYRTTEHAPGSPPVLLAETVTFEDRPVPAELALTSIAISPDGRRAVVAGGYPYATLLDLTVEPPRQRRFGSFLNRVNAVAFTCDGERIVIGTEGPKMGDDTPVGHNVSLWTAEGDEVDAKFILATVRSLAAAPDGRVFVGTTFGAPWVFDSSKDELSPERMAGELTVTYLVMRAEPARLYGVAVPASGVAQLVVWDLAGGREPAAVRTTSIGPGTITSIALSPDGTLVAIGRHDREKEVMFVELWPAGDP